jgi:hypothetical protein
MVMIKATKNSEAGLMPSEELLTAMGAFNEALMKAGVLVGGEGLLPSSHGKRVRLADGETTVTDGPFVTDAGQTRDILAGFWMWQVASMDEAVAWVRRCPAPMPGEETEIEIRPVVTMDDFGDAMTPELRAQEERLAAELEARGTAVR